MMKLQKLAIVALVLNGMTQKELVAVAKNVGVPVGKSLKNTIANLTAEFKSGKAHLSVYATIRTHPDPENGIGQRTLFQKKIRTHKADETVFCEPAPAKAPSAAKP